MRNAVLFTPLVLAACAAAPSPPPVHGEVYGYVCSDDGSRQFIGQPATSEVGAAIMRVTHSARLRWVSPGMMVTMEFSPSRVTVRLGPDNRISAVNCG